MEHNIENTIWKMTLEINSKYKWLSSKAYIKAIWKEDGWGLSKAFKQETNYQDGKGWVAERMPVREGLCKRNNMAKRDSQWDTPSINSWGGQQSYNLTSGWKKLG